MPANTDIYTYLKQVDIFTYNETLCWESILMQLFFISTHSQSHLVCCLKKKILRSPYN